MVNQAKDELAALVAERDIKGNYFIVPSTDNLVADQREYAFPDDLLSHLFSVELAFTSTSPLNYKLALPDDFRRWGAGRTEANVVARYSNELPRYEIQRRSVYVLSGTITAVTNGIRLRSRAYPADLANLSGSSDLSIDPSTTTFGLPRQLHEVWAQRVSIEWKGDHPEAVPLSPLEKQYETNLEKSLSELFENDLSGEIMGGRPTDDGSNY